jgi:prepilin-type N-terminal cleavage/methylation domain-containing protein
MTKKFSRGFTLIELLVVVAIIAILASFALPAYTGVQERAKVTQDLSNLRQIGIATQMYMNDNDGVLFDATGVWMAQLLPKYLPSWKIFQSPFDQSSSRSPAEDATKAPVSYGLNENAHGTAPGDALSADKITNPSLFILFAPAQPFSKHGTDAAVTVSKTSAGPGGAQAGGTHNRGKRINACLADLHVENMLWSQFSNDTSKVGDEKAPQRWNPTAP